MTHDTLVRLYVGGAIASFGLASRLMFRTMDRAWHRKCACCEEPLPRWRRVGMVSVVLLFYALRSVVWFVALPTEAIWLYFNGIPPED